MSFISFGFCTGFYMKECVVVLGMHRSGTSVLTGLVSLFGGYVGSDLMSATEDNPKGYFENNKVYLLNEKILKENRVSWDNYSFSAESIDSAGVDKYVNDAKAVITDELKYVNNLIIKDPRICILFPIWERALNELSINIKLIFAFRSPLEVSHSLLKRDQIEVEKGLMIWSHYFLQSELYSRTYPRMIVEYDNDFKDMIAFLDELAGFLGLSNNDEILQKAADLYSHKLKHHEVALDAISNDLPPYLNSLIQLLKSKSFDNSKTLDDIRDEFSRSKYFFRFDDKKRVEERQELTKTHNRFKDLECAYVELKQKHESEHNLFLETKQELNEERSKSDLAIKELYEKQKTFNAKARTFELESKKNTKSLKDKQHQVDLIKTYYVSAEKLFQRLSKNKSSYKKLDKQALNSRSLKLKQTFFPFAKNKRLTRDKILIIESGLFSPFFYLTVYPDVQHAGIDPLKHFCTRGWKEGRSPSIDFDVKAYLRRHPDVARARINPLIHYIKNGKAEGRVIDPVLFYGQAFVEKDFQTKNKSITFESKSENIVGPIIDQDWDKSIKVISALNNSGKILNKNIPNEIIKSAQEQLVKLPLKVSVIMPTWNRENSICKSIDSILNQSYQPFEIIISDDGSTDNTISILNELYSEQIQKGLIVVLQNPHEGVSETRNKGLQKATGELIAYLDSDNCWRKDYLLIMAAAFSENDELHCAYAALERHDANNNNKKKILAVEYDRKRLLDANFIDMNVFVHKKQLFDQFGGFDVELKRLVDWDLIIQYTKNYSPALIPFVGVDYYLDDVNLKNITTTVSLDDNRERVYKRHFQERVRFGLESLRIAYIIWDFPALSQTFVMNELRWLVKQGFNTKVYYAQVADKRAEIDFDIESYQVNDADHLSELLIEHQRNICHSQFVYPAVTRLTYPASVKANIPFTFMPHAVDLFHHSNIERNKIDEIVQHSLCLKVFVYGEFHKSFLLDRGVPEEKIAFNFQAIDFSDFKTPERKKCKDHNEMRGLVIARFIEKKGIPYLIESASQLKDQAVSFDIYGYGDLQEEYEQKIKTLNVENINLKGVIKNQQELSEAYENYDFLMVPSVVAENGDMDGFPTVILEAIAAGLPVITTDVSAIPDYLTNDVEAIVISSANAEALTEGVNRLLTMSEHRKRSMVNRSQVFLKKMVGVDRSMGLMRDTWQNYTIDIFLVTYNTDEYEDSAETFEIIRRIFAMTTTAFVLTIIDNGSDDDFWEEICKFVAGYKNVRLIRKRENIFCGPASNLALKMADSEYAIYICSKEGFIKKHGWERSLIDYMKENPNIPIGGHLSHIPSYVYGSEYQSLPYFNDFRNKEFAINNPEKPFRHIQGGVFILSRHFFEKHGGFSDVVVQNGMDVEFSHYIESLGYELGEIPEVASLTVKSRPTLSAVINERTVIAHPLTKDAAVNQLDTLTKKNGNRCNLCEWQGAGFDSSGEGLNCPSCKSTSFGRSIYKILSNNSHIHRKESCSVLTKDVSLIAELGKFFSLGTSESKEQLFINDIKPNTDMFIIDSSLVIKNDFQELLKIVVEKLSKNGMILFSDGGKINTIEKSDISKNITDKNCSIKYIDHSSYCLGYDWRKIGCITHNAS